MYNAADAFVFVSSIGVEVIVKSAHALIQIIASSVLVCNDGN